MITSVESLPVMILLLGGLAKVTAAVAKINAATKNRAVSVFKIHKTNRDLYFGYRNRRGLRLRKGRTDNLSKAGWSLGWVSAIDPQGRTIWIVDAHRDDGRRFVVRADEILTAFVELERQVLTTTFYLESGSADRTRQTLKAGQRSSLATTAEELLPPR